MTPERWQQIERVYHAAVAHQVSERAAFLAEACAGDDALRQEVESLLAQDGDVSRFLEIPVAQLAQSVTERSLVGRQLGAYAVEALLGAGGMGEVYKATDTRLNRTVAIKVLPKQFSDIPHAQARFEREAKAISNLSHPHICTLYDVGEAPDPASRAANPAIMRFLVMEYLDGETLAERLTKGPLPLDQVLRYAIQTVDALDTAHRQGVVHRDLKPGNIMLTPSGAARAGTLQVKLLDFGLAKTPLTMDLSGVGAGTVTTPLTGQGTILGTLNYMAPEQAEGRDADARSDLFAFGAVLYEMGTGTRAFEGDSAAGVIAAILTREPPGMSALRPFSPPALDHVVATCLAKNPDERWQNATDLARELRWIAQSPDVPTSAKPKTKPVWREAPLAWIALALGAALLVALAVPAARYLREPFPPTAPEMRLQIVTPPTLSPNQFALSPDERHLVFVVTSGNGVRQLWLRPLDRTEARPIAGTEGSTFPFWSADGRSIAFFASNKLYRIDTPGGSPQVVADNAATGAGTWNAEGTILFSSGQPSPIFRVAASGGKPTAVTRLNPSLETVHLLPQFLPDGRHFLYYARGSPKVSGIYLASLDGGEPKRLTGAAETAGAYLPPGMVAWVQQGALVARRLDLGRRELTGDPVTLADSVSYFPSGNRAGFSISANGGIAYRTAAAETSQLIWFDRTGRVVGVGSEPDANTMNYPQLSPDGRRVAVQRIVQNNRDIWVIDLVRRGFTRFTLDAANEHLPVWSPDGTSIAFHSNRKGIYDLYVAPSTQAGSDTLLLETPHDKYPQDWSNDGRYLLYKEETDPKTGAILWALDLSAKERTPRVVVDAPLAGPKAQISPDGRWVAYETRETGRFEIAVQSFSKPGDRWPVSTNGGSEPRWSADGKELYFIARDAKLMAVSVVVRDGKFEAGTPVALFQTRIVGDGQGIHVMPQYAVARDGRFLINQTVGEPALAPITVIYNWKPPAE